MTPTVALDVVLDEVSCVRAFISPGEAAFPIFASFHVVALVARTVWPGLEALPMLLVFLPVTLIASAVQVAVDSESVRFVILPVPVVDITVGMDQPTLAVGLVVHPVAFVHGTVWPDLDATSLPHLGACEPFTFIASSVLKNNHGALLSFTKLPFELVVVIAELPELRSHFLRTSGVVNYTAGWNSIDLLEANTYLDINIIIILSAVLRIVTHTGLEDLLPQLSNSLASEPSSHSCLASDDNDELLKRVVLPVERLPIRRVSGGELV